MAEVAAIRCRWDKRCAAKGRYVLPHLPSNTWAEVFVHLGSCWRDDRQDASLSVHLMPGTTPIDLSAADMLLGEGDDLMIVVRRLDHYGSLGKPALVESWANPYAGGQLF